MSEPIKNGCRSEQSDTNTETSCDKPGQNSASVARFALRLTDLTLDRRLCSRVSIYFHRMEKLERMDADFALFFLLRLLSVSRPENEAAAVAVAAQSGYDVKSAP